MAFKGESAMSPHLESGDQKFKFQILNSDLSWNLFYLLTFDRCAIELPAIWTYHPFQSNLHKPLYRKSVTMIVADNSKKLLIQIKLF